MEQDNKTIFTELSNNIIEKLRQKYAAMTAAATTTPETEELITSPPKIEENEIILPPVLPPEPSSPKPSQEPPIVQHTEEPPIVQPTQEPSIVQPTQEQSPPGTIAQPSPQTYIQPQISTQPPQSYMGAPANIYIYNTPYYGGPAPPIPGQPLQQGVYTPSVVAPAFSQAPAPAPAPTQPPMQQIVAPPAPPDLTPIMTSIETNANKLNDTLTASSGNITSSMDSLGEKITNAATTISGALSPASAANVAPNLPSNKPTDVEINISPVSDKTRPDYDEIKSFIKSIFRNSMNAFNRIKNKGTTGVPPGAPTVAQEPGAQEPTGAPTDETPGAPTVEQEPVGAPTVEQEPVGAPTDETPGVEPSDAQQPEQKSSIEVSQDNTKQNQTPSIGEGSVSMLDNNGNPIKNMAFKTKEEYIPPPPLAQPQTNEPTPTNNPIEIAAANPDQPPPPPKQGGGADDENKREEEEEKEPQQPNTYIMEFIHKNSPSDTSSTGSSIDTNKDTKPIDIDAEKKSLSEQDKKELENVEKELDKLKGKSFFENGASPFSAADFSKNLDQYFIQPLVGAAEADQTKSSAQSGGGETQKFPDFTIPTEIQTISLPIDATVSGVIITVCDKLVAYKSLITITLGTASGIITSFPTANVNGIPVSDIKAIVNKTVVLLKNNVPMLLEKIIPRVKTVAESRKLDIKEVVLLIVDILEDDKFMDGLLSILDGVSPLLRKINGVPIEIIDIIENIYNLLNAFLRSAPAPAQKGGRFGLPSFGKKTPSSEEKTENAASAADTPALKTKFLNAIKSKINNYQIDINALLDAIRTENEASRNNIINNFMQLLKTFKIDAQKTTIIQNFLQKIFSQKPGDSSPTEPKEPSEITITISPV